MRLECWHTLTAELAAVRLMVGELDFRLATNDFSSTWDKDGWTTMNSSFQDVHVGICPRAHGVQFLAVISVKLVTSKTF